MKVKVNEATKLQIDWLVATVENVEVELDDGALVFGTRYESDLDDDFFGCEFDKLYIPSTDWAQGGPIIEREGIDTSADYQDDALGLDMVRVGWKAAYWNSSVPGTSGFCTWAYGPTPLVAAMRCFVAAKLGKEVEVPDELA